MRFIFILFFSFSFLAPVVMGLSAEEASAQSNTAKKRRGRCKAWSSARYKRMVRNWRKVPQIPKPRWRDGYRDLTIYSVNLGKRIRVFPYLADGSLDPEVIKEVEDLFQDKDTGAQHSLDPRLIKLLYKLADHFKAKQINVISAYREANELDSESNHTQGKAVDFMIPGVSLGGLAWKARRLGHVGVGLYPVSGFIHLDVRDGPSYFWVDRSGPGFGSCMRKLADKGGSRVDYRWKSEDDQPKLHVDKKGVPLGATEKTPPEAETSAGGDAAEAKPKSSLERVH